MNKIFFLMHGLPMYVSASRCGRKYLRSMQRMSGENRDGPSTDYLGDPWQRSLLMRNFSICDRCFKQWIPQGIQGSSGTDRYKMYLRLIPYAWVGQAVRTRLLAAFDLEYDRGAEERSVLQSFVHREWNDLKDRHSFKSEELWAAVDPDRSLPPELELVRYIWQRFFKMVPKDNFPNYYHMVDETHKLALRPRTWENAADYTAENGYFAARISLHIMRDKIPESLEKVLPAFGLWFYCLDEFSDLERDKIKERPTYMLTVGDPVMEMNRLYGEMEKQITGAAPYPRRLLDYLEILHGDILRLKQRGFDIENNLFHDD